MEIYKKFVDIGSYMVVEDTHAAGHPVPWEHENGGPYQAVEEFLSNNDDFEVDWECEKHLMTFNPKGYLRRVK
jgi:cephalosporin hydroxylase